MANTRKHTLESCRAVAAMVSTITQLKKQHENVYAAASRGGWLDTLGLQRDTAPAESWTFERIAEASKLYASRSAMRRGPHQHAYNVAHKRGWSDALPAKVKRPKKAKPLPKPQSIRYWTEERCKAAAAQCTSRTDMQQKHPNAYAAACRYGYINTLGLPPKTRWTLETCRKVALSCVSRKDLQRRFPGAYEAATRNGWAGELGIPKYAWAGDADTFYVWQAKGCLFNGKPVYKVGITSWRLGDKRVKEVAKKAKVKALILLRIRTQEAASVEAFALSLGDNPLLCVPDGRTEFRAYSDAEVGAIAKRAIFG